MPDRTNLDADNVEHLQTVFEKAAKYERMVQVLAGEDPTALAELLLADPCAAALFQVGIGVGLRRGELLEQRRRRRRTEERDPQRGGGPL